jgi:hypothetical protein
LKLLVGEDDWTWVEKAVEEALAGNARRCGEGCGEGSGKGGGGQRERRWGDARAAGLVLGCLTRPW